MDVAVAVRAYLDRMIQQVAGVTILLLDSETVSWGAEWPAGPFRLSLWLTPYT